MIKTKNRKFFMFLCLVFIIAIIVVLRLSIQSESLSVLLQAAEFIGVLCTIVFTVQQLIDSKEISRATFIMELNQNYVGNPEYIKIYNELQIAFDNMQSNKNAGLNDLASKIDKGSISNYLTFFETLYVLKNRGVVSFDIIDDLFAYRFFLAVHSELFQKCKLEAQPDNFRNIFKLEHEWLEYRIRVGKNSRKKLDEANKKYISMSDEEKKTAAWDNVYEARQLRSLVNEEKYNELIMD